MAVLEELSKCKLELVGLRGVRWDGGGTKSAIEHNFLYGKGIRTIN
jgi:hypothetical protein